MEQAFYTVFSNSASGIGLNSFQLAAGLQPAHKKEPLLSNADQLRSFTVNFLTFWAIHGGVLPFLNQIFGARFVLLFRQKNQKHLSSAKPVHFLYLNNFRRKNSPFQRPHRLRMTLPRIK